MTPKRTSLGSASARQRPRRPGRPAAAALSGEQLREAIVAGGARVYAERGYHGVTVEHVLEEAAISRPTFYRYFSDRYAVLDEMIGAVNDQLRDLILSAVVDADDIDELLHNVVEAYFTWGESIGPMAGPLYCEINDRASPASKHRERLLRELLEVFTAQPVDGLGITQEKLLFDAAMHVVEHLGHTTFWPVKLPVRAREERKAIIVQAVRGMLSAPSESV
ncbi:MAG: hypothetical protein Hals2KO_18830 [Halioglobus sp.]